MRLAQPGEEAYSRRGRRATEAYVLLMVTAFPLFTGLDGYVLLQLKKYLFFLAATAAWLLFLGVNRVLQLLRERRLPRVSMPVLCLLAFAALASLSTLCSEYAVFFSAVVGKYDNLLTYLLYTGVLIGVRRYGASPVRCLWAFAASYTACCGVAAAQLCGRNALGLFPEGYTYYSPYVQETGAFLGTLGNIDVFSALHCLALPLFAAAVLYGARKRRFFLLVPIALGLVCMIAAGVASGLLACCLTAAVLAVGRAAARLRSRGVKKRWILLGGAALLLLILAVLYLVPFRGGTLRELSAVLHGELRDSFGSHRILIWRKSVAVLRKHILLGIGPDTLENYLDIRFSRYSELLGETLVTTVDNAHNAYLQLLLNFGLLGLIPLSILMTDTWDGIRSALPGSREMRVLSLPMLCYLIQAFFNIGTCIVVPLFLILWGMILHAARDSGSGTETNKETVFNTRMGEAQ